MTRKRTFSLPDDLSDELDRASGGNASAYVADAVREALVADSLHLAVAALRARVLAR